MSSIQRLTLISDPTDEFPKNANNSFKVRLPERLTLPGEGWHASLMSLTVPDQGQSNAVIATDPHTKVIRFKFTQVIRWYQLGSYRRVETPAIDSIVELENIMNTDHIVATGSMFWKRVMQEVNTKIMNIVATKQKQLLVSRRDERPVVSVKKKNAMPQLSWKDDNLMIHAIPKEQLLNVHQIAMADFHINLAIALKFGLVLEKTANKTTTCVLVPNLQYILPMSTYNRHTMPTGDSFRTYYNWEGEQYTGINYINDPFQVVTVENVKYLKLHLVFDWQLNNLNASFGNQQTYRDGLFGYRAIHRGGEWQVSPLAGSAVVENRRRRNLSGTPTLSMDQSARESNGYCGGGDCHTQCTPGRLVPWQNPGDHWSQTAIKSPTPLSRVKKHFHVNRDARRKFNAVAHARGHQARGQRVGRRLDQTGGTPDRAASSSGTARYSTRKECGGHVGRSKCATQPRIETQSPRHGLDGRQTQGQTDRPKYL